MSDPRRKTPLERALERLEREAEIYKREQERYLQGREDHDEEFRIAMYRAGRTDRPFREDVY